MSKQLHPLIQELLDYNRRQSEKFVDPGETLSRRQFRAANPVEIAATKCMDARCNMSIITGAPVGIIQPFRNIGGKFDVGGHFGELLDGWVKRAVQKGSDAIVLVTYHWSKGQRERGCKGFHCDVDAAREYTKHFVGDIEDVFGKDHSVVYPVRVGIETDEDALVFHGANGKVYDLSEAASDDSDAIRIRLEGLYPDMKRRMIDSLVNLCAGNIRHIAEIRKAGRSIMAFDHQEQILSVGRGFDWFHQPNKMLIVGPYDYALAEPIAVAASIILDNIKSGRIPKDQGCALVTSALFRETGPELARAKKKAASLMRFAFATIEDKVPDLIPYLVRAGGVLDQNTQEFTLLDLD